VVTTEGSHVGSNPTRTKTQTGTEMMADLIFHAERKDFRIDYFSGTGAGGQYRNKHQNCVRLTHVATGIVTTGQEQRSREQNQRDAFQKMAKLLVARALGDQRKARWPGNSETIRTYHEPDNRVVDYASRFQQPYDVVVGGRDLSRMIEARLAVKVAVL
jgi:peptide chain release factor 1